MDSQLAPAQEDILRRICGEYLEMPGLRLKREQAQRLWGLDGATCTTLLDTLVASGFLCRFLDGRYGRSTDGAVKPAMPMARASLEFKSVRGEKISAA
jgi:hypothetical protein